MSRRDIGTDDARVRVRPPRSSRPRTKDRPKHADAVTGFVFSVDRGRYGVLLPDGTRIVAMKARELGRGRVVVGDHARVVGDLSGRKDTLARIVGLEPRTTQLRRSAEDGDLAGHERVVVANAQQLVVVTALADPPPRVRMIDRYLVAAYDAGMEPVLCLTKADLADPGELLAAYQPLGVRSLVVAFPPDGQEPDLTEVKALLTGQVSVLVGHSGVGKSTLVNALTGAERATGDVNDVTGRGRHTSTSAVALALPTGGWVIDTPGVRSFGLAHVQDDDVLRAFADLDEAVADCPRGCTHTTAEPECALSAPGRDEVFAARVDSYRRLMAARLGPDGDGRA